MSEYATAIHSKAIDRACADDAAWFAVHPSRIFRLRDAIPFEFNRDIGLPPWQETWRALVAQGAPGVRFRCQLSAPIEVSNEDAVDDLLRPIFEQIAPPDLLTAFEKLLR